MGGADGVVQGRDPREGRASLAVREGLHQLCNGALPRLGQNRNCLCLLFGLANLLLAECATPALRRGLPRSQTPLLVLPHGSAAATSPETARKPPARARPCLFRDS